MALRLWKRGCRRPLTKSDPSTVRQDNLMTNTVSSTSMLHRMWNETLRSILYTTCQLYESKVVADYSLMSRPSRRAKLWALVPKAFFTLSKPSAAEAKLLRGKKRRRKKREKKGCETHKTANTRTNQRPPARAAVCCIDAVAQAPSTPHARAH